MVEQVINEFRAKFPERLYFTASAGAGNEATTNVGVALQSIPTETASYFAVLRDHVIRHWNLDDLEMRHLGSEHDPLDLKHLGIDNKALLTVAQLLSKDHKKVPLLTPEEVEKCDEVVRKLALDKYRATYFHRSR